MSNHTALTRGRSGEICVPLEATSACKSLHEVEIEEEPSMPTCHDRWAFCAAAQHRL